MGRVPAVERCPLTGGLTMESATLWYYFLADEADVDGAAELCREYLGKAEQLSQFQGSVADHRLEEAIKKWNG